MGKVFLILLVFLLSYSENYAVSYSAGQDSVQFKDYTNSLLLNNKVGVLIVYNDDRLEKKAFVRWSNGFFSEGLMRDNKPTGTWNLFDRKNRLREIKIFGFNGECILHSKQYSKNGKLISTFNIHTPCF